MIRIVMKYSNDWMVMCMAERKPFGGVDDRVKLADVVPLNTPFTLNVFPSNICNFRCNYCAQSLGKEKLLEKYGFPMELMSVDTLAIAIEQAKEFGEPFKLVSFMGHGEPLCNRRLPEMIRMVKEAGIAKRVDIITNASLLDEAYSDELIDAGLDVLRVSLQGISAEKYEKICNYKIDFARFVNRLGYFYSHRKKCKVFLKTVDAALEFGEDEKFYEIFSPISDRIYVDKVKPVYDGVNYSENEKDLSTDRYGTMHGRRMVCPQPFYMLSLWANGDVTPCDALYKASPLGNVYTRSLKQMWNGEIHREFCRLQLKGKRMEHPACSKCCAPDDVSAKEDVLDDEMYRLAYAYGERGLFKC